MVEGGTSVLYVNMNDTRKFLVLQRHIHDKIPQCRHAQDLTSCIGKQFNTRGLLITLDNTDFTWIEKEDNAKLKLSVHMTGSIEGIKDSRNAHNYAHRGQKNDEIVQNGRQFTAAAVIVIAIMYGCIQDQQ